MNISEDAAVASKPSSDLCLAALALAEAGFFVLPLSGKVAIVEGGAHAATRDEERILGWWTKWPDANIGIATGRELPGGGFLAAVDIDRRHGGADVYAQISPGHAETRTHATGDDGAHLLYRTSEAMPSFVLGRGTDGKSKAVELKGSGSYIVAPPSVHPDTGKAYEVADARELSAAPAWIYDAYLRHRLAQGEKNPHVAVPMAPDHPRYAERLEKGRTWAREAPAAADGTGGGPLFALALRLVRTLELSDEDAMRLILEEFNPRATDSEGRPWPWDERDIQHKLEEARHRSEIPCGLAEGIADKLKEKSNRKECARSDELKQHLGHLRDTANAQSMTNPSVNIDPSLWNLQRGDGVEIAEKVRAHLPGLLFAEGAFYLYDDTRGIWTSEGLEARIKAMVRSMAGAPLGKNSLRLNAPAISGALEILGDMVENATFFDDATEGLACPNGFLRLTSEGVELVPHSKNHRARVAHPIAYDKNARSHRWDGFLEDLFLGDVDADDKVACLAEFFGCALFGLATLYQKCVIALGTGANGKSKLLEIVSSVFPRERVLAFPPQNLEKEYWRARLPGALLNAVAEMPAATILASESFKAIVTGDQIDAREPNKPVIVFRPKAGHFFGANALPGTTDQSPGFWRRFIVLGFNRNFERGGADKEIAEKVLADGREAVFAWLVDGAVRLKKNASYTIPASHEGLHKRWRQESDSVSPWFEECVSVEETPTTKSRELYRCYRWWAEGGGYKPVAENKFGERLRHLGYDREGKEKKLRLRVLDEARPPVGALTPIRRSA